MIARQRTQNRPPGRCRRLQIRHSLQPTLWQASTGTRLPGRTRGRKTMATRAGFPTESTLRPRATFPEMSLAACHSIARRQRQLRLLPAPGARANSSGPAPAVAPTPPAPPLYPALVLQRMDKAEIRIGLQSEGFGAVRLHTTVSGDQVGAVVSTSHPGLRDALVVEAPSLEKAMAGHRFRLDSVQVNGGASDAGFNGFGSNERQPEARRDAWRGRGPAGREQSVLPASSAAADGSHGGYRLDVRV